MAVSNDFLQFVLDQLSNWSHVPIKKMFGGVTLYHNELVFGIIMNDVLYLKVDETNLEKFIKAGSEPLKPFKSNATVLSFYNVPIEILENNDALIKWAKESLIIQQKRNN